MTRTVGLDHLTLLNLSPPELVTVAAGAGFTAVGLRVSPVTQAEPVWPLVPGSAMMTETRTRLAASGLSVLDAEAVYVADDPARSEPVIETAASLGASYLTVLCDEPDLDRFADRFAALTRLAASYRVRSVVEFMAFRPLRTLEDAKAIVKRSGGGGLLLDTLHIQRCGVSPADLAELDPALLSYLQICDAPARPEADLVKEARAGRLLPGEGELPLPEILAALPKTLPVSVEAPSALDGGDPAGFARRARHAVADVLRQAA